MQNLLKRKFEEFKWLTLKKFYPGYCLIDPFFVKKINTDYGIFELTDSLKNYPNIFNDVNLYKIDDLNETDVVLDLGAFIGAFSARISKKVSQVYSFEPLFYEELKRTISLNNLENVKAFPFAVGKIDSIEFCWKKESVKSFSLAEIIKMCDKKPTFLKMDIEGSEWDINLSEFESFRGIEAEIHTFSNHDPIYFIEQLEKIGYEIEFFLDKNGQFMISGRK